MAGPARDYFLHGSHYLRKTVKFDTVNAGSTNGIEMDFQVGAGSFISSIDLQIVTPFNAGTTNDLTVGVAGNPSAYVTTGQSAATVAGVKKIPGPGRIAADTTVVIKYAQAGTAPTAGEADVIVHFLPR